MTCCSSALSGRVSFVQLRFLVGKIPSMAIVTSVEVVALDVWTLATRTRVSAAATLHTLNPKR